MSKSISFVILFLTLFANTIFADVGIVSALRGDAELIRANRSVPLHLGDRLEEKDTIKTAQNAKVQLTFKDRTVITIGKNSRFSIEEYLFDNTESSKVRFAMPKGFFRSISGKIGKIVPERFKLHTKNATIGIRGTEIVIEADPLRGDKIACTFGRIFVKPKSFAQSIDVEAGKMVFVKPGELPRPPVAIEKERFAVSFQKHENVQPNSEPLAEGYVNEAEDTNKYNDLEEQTEGVEPVTQNSDAPSGSNPSQSPAPPVSETPGQTPPTAQTPGGETPGSSTPSSGDNLSGSTPETPIDTPPSSNPTTDPGDSTGSQSPIPSPGDMPQPDLPTPPQNNPEASMPTPSDGDMPDPSASMPTPSEGNTPDPSATMPTPDTVPSPSDIPQSPPASSGDTGTETTPTTPDIPSSPGASMPTNPSDVVSGGASEPSQETSYEPQKITTYSYDDEISYGYWTDESGAPSTTWFEGNTKTSTFRMLASHFAHQKASYEGGVTALTNGKVADGSILLNFDFWEETFNGNMNFQAEGEPKWSVDLQGDVSSNHFTANTVTPASDSDVNDLTQSALEGDFYGMTGPKYIGGSFELQSASHGTAKGVFGGKEK